MGRCGEPPGASGEYAGAIRCAGAGSIRHKQTASFLSIGIFSTGLGAGRIRIIVTALFVGGRFSLLLQVGIGSAIAEAGEMPKKWTESVVFTGARDCAC